MRHFVFFNQLSETRARSARSLAGAPGNEKSPRRDPMGLKYNSLIIIYVFHMRDASSRVFSSFILTYPSQVNQMSISAQSTASDS